MALQWWITFLAAGFLIAGMLFTLWLLVAIVSRFLDNVMHKRLEKALLRRRLANDPFRDDNGYSWDVVMTFPVHKHASPLSTEQRLYSTKFILSRLSEGGLEFRLFYSVKHDTVFCKIRASTERLMIEADRIKLKMVYDEKRLEVLCRKGREAEGLWSPLKIPDKCVETKLPPFRFIYGSFQYDPETRSPPPHLSDLYKRWSSTRLVSRSSFSTPSPLQDQQPGGALVGSIKDSSSSSLNDGKSSPRVPSPMQIAMPVDESVVDVELEGFVKVEDLLLFRSADRLKLIDSIINDNTPGGCCLDMDQLLKTRCVTGYLALHDQVSLIALEKQWLNLFELPWNQNVDLVKNYFGERIGLFFVFLGHQTTWVALAAVIGTGCWINVSVANNNPNALIVPYFAGFMCLWTTFHLESFQRAQKKAAQRWGMVGFEMEELERPQFYGAQIKSPVTGKHVLYFPPSERFRRSTRSYIAVLFSLTIAVGVLSLILFIRYLISYFTNAPRGLSQVVTSILVSIQIESLNAYYVRGAILLNNNENYRTETEYEDSLILKTFVFQFINSFGCLFYVSFLQPFIRSQDPCEFLYCYDELQVTLGSIFMSRLVIGNSLKVLRPMIKAFLSTQEALAINSKTNPEAGGSGADLRNEMSEVEKSFMLERFDPLLSTFYDYANMATQYGFMTMFVAAFPLTAALAFVNNFVELRVNAWRLCQLYQRPHPRSAEDIGTWFIVFEVISVAAVFTNAGIVCFTGNYMIKFNWTLRAWLFILISAITIL